MEDNHVDEPVGLKVKTVTNDSDPKDDMITVTDDKSLTEYNEYLEDLLGEEIPDEEDTIVVHKEDVINNTIPVDSTFKKIGCARLITNEGTTVYRFDIYHKEYKVNNGTFEFKNIANNFNNVKANKNSPFNKNSITYADFFAAFGIIRWNFSSTLMPINTNAISAITQIESLINEYLHNAGVDKKFTFRIETVSEE